MDKSRIITLLSDFGLQDHYVAVMKGVILGISPGLKLLDISHSVPPRDIRSAAFVLGQAYRWFPAGTIHLAVVDPGVGTARKGLAVSAGGHFFVAPDNGILSYVYEREDDVRAHEITADHYFLKPVSSTFHGRDIFAPIAAWLAHDIPLAQIGPDRPNPVRLQIPALTRVRDGLIQAGVLAVDHFGNLITNLKPSDLPVFGAHGTRPCKVLAGQREITTFRSTFGEGAAGELFIVPGSSGYLEIVARDGSAASALNLAAGAPIGVVLG
jgi:S-adenosylmethionine hydrolase